MASASLRSPLATSSSASESSAVRRLGWESVASQYARLSPSQHTVTAPPLIVADIYVADGACADDPRLVRARWAWRTAARDASAGSSPRRIDVSSIRTAACVPASDASSDLGEVDTPSQTTATATGPVSVSAVANAIASSLRECRRPRSVTPASQPRSSSTWSRPEGTWRPHDSQRPSALIAPGKAEGSTEHTGHCATYPGGLGSVSWSVAASSVPQDSQKLSAAQTGSPQAGQLRLRAPPAVMTASPSRRYSWSLWYS